MFTKQESDQVAAALRILESKLKQGGIVLDDSQDAAHYCRLWLAPQRRELCGVLSLDAQLRLIRSHIVSMGTPDTFHLDVREVARLALLDDAFSVIITHNHVTGDCQPSMADRQATESLQDALELFGIRLIDHIIVGLGDSFSFANSGIL